MTNVLHEAAERAVRYLGTLESRPVAPSPESIAALAALDGPLPAGPSDPSETLRRLDELVSPATMGMAGARFFGFVIGGALPAALAANWLAGAWDQNAVLYRPTPGVAHVEAAALRWLLEALELPPTCAGAFVTGATVANLCALAAARHAVLERVGWNVEAKGLFGAPEIQVIAGAEVHPSVTKSLGVLGLGRSRLTLVPVDGEGRIRPDRMPKVSGPAIVILQAGNVNTGACDPFPELIAAAHAAGAWVHVDGAFGLWAAASPRHAALVRGIDGADSWATDAHKWLNVPYDCGLAFVRDGHPLRAAMAVTAEYLPTETPHRNPADYVPELSRRARGVEVWAALHSLGRAGLAELIERNCRCARAMAGRLRAAGFAILNEVVLNQVLVSFGSAEATQRVIEAIQAEGTCWAGITQWQGQTAMRISVSSWKTTDADAERSVEAMIRTALLVTRPGGSEAAR